MVQIIKSSRKYQSYSRKQSRTFLVVHRVYIVVSERHSRHHALSFKYGTLLYVGDLHVSCSNCVHPMNRLSLLLRAPIVCVMAGLTYFMKRCYKWARNIGYTERDLGDRQRLSHGIIFGV